MCAAFASLAGGGGDFGMGACAHEGEGALGELAGGQYGKTRRGSRAKRKVSA